MTVMDSMGRQIQVRFAGIDAPEKTQEFGIEARKNLELLIFGKVIIIQAFKTDKYGRTIAKIDKKMVGTRRLELLTPTVSR